MYSRDMSNLSRSSLKVNDVTNHPYEETLDLLVVLKCYVKQFQVSPPRQLTVLMAVSLMPTRLSHPSNRHS